MTDPENEICGSSDDLAEIVEEVLDENYEDDFCQNSQNSQNIDVYQQASNTTVDNTSDDYAFTYSSQDERVCDLLKHWGLSDLCKLFGERNIDLDCLKHITVSDIDNLISQELMGLRIKFKARLAQWRSLKSLPLSSISESLAIVPSRPVSGSSSDVTEILRKPTIILRSDSENSLNQELQNLNVLQILKSNARGKVLLSKTEPFNSSERKDLITLILDFALYNDIVLSTKEINSLAEQIIKIFPFEAKNCYYVASGNGGRCRGQLYTSYNNKVKALRRRGVLSSCSKHRIVSTSENSSSSSPSSPSSSSPAVNNRNLAEKDWLKYNSQPLELVAIKWKSCFGIRRSEILEKTAAEIFDEWPLYTQSPGLYLIDSDFTSLFDEEKSMSLKKHWASFQTTFLESALNQAGSASKPVKLLLTEINATENRDYKDLLTFKLLHHKLRFCHKISLESGKKWHFSIQDAINSNIIEAENQSDVLVKYRQIKESHKNLNLNLQPMVVASENSFYLVSDNIFHKADSFLSALDSAFKLIYVFNLKYPPQSQNVWLFIENFFFKLNSSLLSSSTTALINELRAKQN